MKKLILSSLAVLGLSAAFVAPAKAQLINGSTSPSFTGAASFVNTDGSVSTSAAEAVFPDGYLFTSGGDATVTHIANPANAAQTVISVIQLNATAAAPAAPATVEAEVAATLNGLSGGINDTNGLSQYVGIVRAWRSGGLD